MLVRLLKIFALVSMLAGLVLPSVSMAQTGHPAKGSWSGVLTPDSGEPSRIRLLMDDHNGALSGSVNPGRNSVVMTSVVLDASNFGLNIQATMPDGALELQGTLSNLGSWTNRKYIGTYKLGTKTGKFEITLN